jgi:hypothetical protein
LDEEKKDITKDGISIKLTTDCDFS